MCSIYCFLGIAAGVQSLLTVEYYCSCLLLALNWLLYIRDDCGQGISCMIIVLYTLLFLFAVTNERVVSECKILFHFALHLCAKCTNRQSHTTLYTSSRSPVYAANTSLPSGMMAIKIVILTKTAAQASQRLLLMPANSRENMS